jgi:5-(carboxyamino)imidazole ribonucleotide mutase
MAKKTAPCASVAVIMGSDSDLKELAPCFETLEHFGIAYSATIASAHRTHDFLKQTVKDFERNGGRIVIAAAGGAAHLPGVVAALTPLPVIGVPMSSKLMGMDSLLSIVQMPAGMPVASVAIGGAKNAALLSAQILALGNAGLRNKYDEFRAKQADAVIAKSKRLSQKGHRDYFEKG